MASLDQLKRTFFDECSEPLQQIESGLTDIREGNGIGRHHQRGIPRRAFGQGRRRNLRLRRAGQVRARVRNGAGCHAAAASCRARQDTIDTLLHGQRRAVGSRRHVALRRGDPAGLRRGMPRRARAHPAGQFGGDEWGDDGSAAAADFDGIDFMPVPFRSSSTTVDEQPGDRLSRSSSGRKPDLLKKANEPLYILRELRRLGTLELSVETERLPLLTELEPDRAISGWTGTLRTRRRVAQIRRSVRIRRRRLRA